MAEPNDKAGFEFEMLKRYGAKWAVLTAMTADMAGKGIKLPQDVFESLRRVRSDLESGCFSTCGVSCDLSQAEGPIFSQCNLLDPQEFQAWSDLLAEAMSGKLDYQRMLGIPALHHVKNDCVFLRCECSS